MTKMKQAELVAPATTTIRRVSLALAVIGFGCFALEIWGVHKDRAWGIYLLNFLLWSAIAQGGLLVSTVMHLTNARWGRSVSGVSEAFAAFFPCSFALFLILFLGRTHLFPWLQEGAHDRDPWLNISFLFTRDSIGLLVLYGLGWGYLSCALRFKTNGPSKHSRIRSLLQRGEMQRIPDAERWKNRMTLLGVLYVLAYSLVLTLLSFDLVMGMAPHWYSTLFGPYSFVKAFYLGLGGVIILSNVVRLAQGDRSGLLSSDFHDLGKLFFAFCLLWADFFYAQLLVIWYGNISEETAFVITRTATHPWKTLAWGVFVSCFLFPFFVLLNRKIKTQALPMISLCSIVVVGMWFEHLLLLGPALGIRPLSFTMGLSDGLISFGFLGLFAYALIHFLDAFPELITVQKERKNP